MSNYTDKEIAKLEKANSAPSSSTEDKHVLSKTLDTKVTSKETRQEARERMREEIRNSLSARGPQHVPEHMKNPEYCYLFDILDLKAPFKFQTNFTLGYTHVTSEDMPLYRDYLGSYQGGFSMIDDGGRIGIKYSDTKTLYLLKIPRDRHEIVMELREEARMAPIQAMKQRSQRDGYFGSIDITAAGLNAMSSDNYSTNPPQKN